MSNTLIAPPSFLDQMSSDLIDRQMEHLQYRPTVCGVTIVESAYLPKKYVQSRYPVSKKKRIRRKYAKKYGRWIEQAYLFDSKLLDSIKLKLEHRLDDSIFKDSHTHEVPFYTWYGSPFK